MPTRRAALLALLPLVSAFAPSPPLRAPPAASSAIRSGQPAVCRRGAAPLALIAGLDPGAAAHVPSTVSGRVVLWAGVFLRWNRTHRGPRFPTASSRQPALGQIFPACRTCRE